LDIRPARPDEHRELSQIAVASKAQWGYSSEQLRIWKRELEISAASIASQPTFVAEESGALVGVVQLNPRVQPWELEALWVLPVASGRGVGRALLQQALLVARRAQQEEVAIDADPNAEGFYLALGAKRTGERRAPIAGQPRRIRPQLRLVVGEA